MTCACGCLGRPGPGKRFVHGHNTRVQKRSHEWYVAQGHRTAASRPREFWQESGRQGGRTTNIQKWATLLRVWASMNPREALRLAYERGYGAGYAAGRTAGEQRVSRG